MRREFEDAVILSGGYDAQAGAEAIQNGEGKAIAYGISFIANPDLVERFKRDAPVNEADPGTFYTHDRQGYVDYLPLAGQLLAHLRGKPNKGRQVRGVKMAQRVLIATKIIFESSVNR